MCERLETNDPFSCGLLHLIEVVPQSGLVLYRDSGNAYRRAFGLEKGASGGVLREPVHVFAAERYALAYEQRLKELELAPWTFNPLFVAALEYRERARIFAQAVLAGYLVQKSVGSDRYVYRMELPNEGVGVALGRDREDAEKPEAQLVVAMRTFVLGRPNDASPHRPGSDELAAMVKRELARDPRLLARKLKALDDARFVIQEEARERAIQEALPPYILREAGLPGGRELVAFVRLVALDAYPQFCAQWSGQVRQECTALWAEGSSVSTGEALEGIQSLTEVVPDGADVQELLAQARERDEQAHRVEEKWLQMLRRAQFAPLVAEYTEAQGQGRRQVPRRVPARDPQGRFLLEKTAAGDIVRLEPDPAGWVEIVPAFEELRSLAEQYAQQKAEDSLGQAREVLERDPLQAQRLVREALELYLLPESWRQALNDFNRIEVEPAAERRRRAETLRDEGLRESDVVAGWRRLKEAEDLDPYVPRLVEARGQLRSRMIRYVQQTIERAEVLRRAGQMDEAREAVMELWELVRPDPTLREWSERLQQWLQQE